MDRDALATELTRAADGDLPYDVDTGAYRSAWHDAPQYDRERVDAVSPALGRALDDYTDALDAMNAARTEIASRAVTLAWALPDLVEERDGYRLVLSRHPTRDRTVIYDPVGRFVERFEDGFREAVGPDALRSRMLGKALAQRPWYASHIRRWDDRYDGWAEVVWAWRTAEDIPAVLRDRQDAQADAVDAADAGRARMADARIAGRL